MKLLLCNLLFLSFLFSNSIFANKFIRSKTLNSTKVYALPSFNSKLSGVLKKGATLIIEKNTVNNFHLIKTKSGKESWVNSNDITLLYNHQENNFFPKFTYNFGGGFGVYNNLSFYEVNFSLNTFFKSNFFLTNSIFYRTYPTLTESNFFGLDSTINYIYTPVSFTQINCGIGARLTDKLSLSPLAKVSFTISLPIITISIGAKAILHSISNKTQDNELIYIVGFSGGGLL
jgi:hypothetical protein